MKTSLNLGQMCFPVKLSKIEFYFRFRREIQLNSELTYVFPLIPFEDVLSFSGLKGEKSSVNTVLSNDM